MTKVKRQDKGAGPSAPPSSTLVGASFVERNDKGEIKKVRYTSMAKYLIKEHGACLINTEPAWLRYPEGDPECDGLYDAGVDAIVEVGQTYVPNMRTSEYREVYKHLKALLKRDPSRWYCPDPMVFATRNGHVLRVVTPPAASSPRVEEAPEHEVAGMHVLRDSVIDADYDPYAWSDTLFRILMDYADGDLARYRRMLEAMGTTLCMAGDGKGLIVFYGLGGDGKSTLLKILTSVLGRGSYVSMKLNELGARFGPAPLSGRRLMVDDDMSQNPVSGDALAIVKSIVEGGVVDAEVKGETLRVSVSGTTIMVATNHPPQFPQLDAGYTMRRRLVAIRFKNRVVPGARRLRYEEAVTKDERRRSAFLNLMMCGLLSFLSRGGYTPVPEDDAMADEWLGNVDTVSLFLEEVDVFGVSWGDMPHLVSAGDRSGTLMVYPLALWDEARSLQEGMSFENANYYSENSGTAFYDEERGGIDFRAVARNFLGCGFTHEYSVVYARYQAWHHKRGANGKGMLGSTAFARKLRELGYDTYTARTGLGAEKGKTRTAKFVVPRGVSRKEDFEDFRLGAKYAKEE